MGRNPFTELDIIERIRSLQMITDPQVKLGIGDDCAVLRRPGGMVELLTMDTMIEGVHFNQDWHPPELLGRKAASVNVSDIAAMGGMPRQALLSLGLTNETPTQWIDAFMAGFLAVLAAHDIMLIGGDTVKNPAGVVVSVTLIGAAEEKKVLYRSGARLGDLVWISDVPGIAAAGLELCRAGLAEDEQWRRLVDAHRDPVPEVALGRLLAESGLVNAMMDTSDGIATDLAHICRASGCGADVDRDALPGSELMIAAGNLLQQDPLVWALKGGEDFLLLFTSPASARTKLTELIREKIDRKIYCIGSVTEKDRVILRQGQELKDIAFQGYDHFR